MAIRGISPVETHDEAAWSVVDPALARAFLAQLECEREARALLTKKVELASVLAFNGALEARSADTAGHSDRVSVSSKLIALRMGVALAVVEHIALAGRLHDIGKVAIPDAILLKPGSLDEAEFAVMKTHSARGAEMLATVELAAEVCAMVRAHHERWDGTGYPDGLSRGEISQGARIVAVADAYDAIRSVRPYRPARSRDEALSYLEHARGNHLDPDVVDVFVTLSVPEPPQSCAPEVAVTTRTSRRREARRQGASA